MSKEKTIEAFILANKGSYITSIGAFDIAKVAKSKISVEQSNHAFNTLDEALCFVARMVNGGASVMFYFPGRDAPQLVANHDLSFSVSYCGKVKRWAYVGKLPVHFRDLLNLVRDPTPPTAEWRSLTPDPISFTQTAKR